MTFTPDRASVNQKLQIGAESTSALGTTVPSNKLLLCFDYVFGIDVDQKYFRATGHKYNSESNLNKEWTGGTLSGEGDYNGLIYPLAGAMGSVAPVAHGASSTAKDWIFSPPLSGSIVPQTYSLQQGDSTHAHGFSYGLHTDFGYKCTRGEFTVNGKLIAQQFTDAVTLTSSPTAIALAPITGNQVNVYLDSTSSGLGTTQLTKFLSVDFSMAGIYKPTWFLNRANASFTSHVDVAPATMVKLLLEADTQGMSLLSNLRAGTTVYLRVDAQGAVIDGANSANNHFVHDMAIKVGKPAPFSDSDGIFAIEWECTVVEDSTWGHAHTATVTNLITAL